MLTPIYNAHHVTPIRKGIYLCLIQERFAEALGVTLNDLETRNWFCFWDGENWTEENTGLPVLLDGWRGLTFAYRGGK